MDASTGALLAAIADLASYAQAHPTDVVGIAARRRARTRAEQDWLSAGSPDRPDGTARPATPPARAPVPSDQDGKDWRPVRRLLEVVSITDGGAARLTDGERTGYAPLSLLWLPGTRDAALLEVGEVYSLDLPRWLADEKGWE